MAQGYVTLRGARHRREPASTAARARLSRQRGITGLGRGGRLRRSVRHPLPTHNERNYPRPSGFMTGSAEPISVRREGTMLGSLLGILAFALVAALFVWLVTRAWRARRPVLRWLGVVPAALFALLFTALTVLAAIGLYRLQAPHTNPVAAVQVAGTPEQIARGERFATGC